jgi:hypothetical protein
MLERILSSLFPPKMGHIGEEYVRTHTTEWLDRLERQDRCIFELHEPAVRLIPQKCLPPARIYALPGRVE